MAPKAAWGVPRPMRLVIRATIIFNCFIIPGFAKAETPAPVKLIPCANEETCRVADECLTMDWLRIEVIRPLQPSEKSYVITHGMGGSSPNDRFHELAWQIADRCPDATIYLIDWSAKTNQRLFGMLSPWSVARFIDRAGDMVSEVLQNERINTSHVCLIGESFGNCVNHRIASRLGEVASLIACNPANALGGYPTPDLRTSSRFALVLQSDSPFDAQDAAADARIQLPGEEWEHASAPAMSKHTAGIRWLSDHSEIWAPVNPSGQLVTEPISIADSHFSN